MVRTRFLASALAVTSALAIAHPALAQLPAPSYQPQMTPAATPDADALANAMRQLATNPRDLTALITAGELSLKVGDASGAAALFKRAEQVDPMNGRVKAGMARILVTQERPGEALRYFDQAVGYGLDPRTFAGDRGLAYDLIGEQERAQRDYRLALKSGDSDEVRRRYALSLAISGNQLGAFEQLEPLTRRNDRAAWRARAFVLAMTGDVAGANRIAQGMMPGGMAQALGPFFTRLPTLSPVDKAFAVHFGEVGPTPQRLADARLTPVLAALGPDPDARPTRIVVPSPPPQDPRAKKGRNRNRSSRNRVQVASVTPRAPSPVVAPAVTPGFGSAGQSPTDPVRTATAVPTATAALPAATPVGQPSASAPAPVRFARAEVDPIQKATLADYGRVQRLNEERARRLARRGSTRGGAGSAAAGVAPASAPTQGSMTAQAATLAANPPAAVRPAAPPPASGASFALANTTPAPSSPLASSTQVAAVPPASTYVPAASNTQIAAQPALATPSTTPTPLAANEDSILARIVQGLTIPGAELGVAPPPAPALASAAPAAAAPSDPIGSTAAAPSTTPVLAASAGKPVAPAPSRASAPVVETSRAKPASVELVDAATPKPGSHARAVEADEKPVSATVAGRRGATTRATGADEADPSPTRNRSRRRVDARIAAKEDADVDTGATRGKRGAAAVTAKDDAAPAAKGKRGAATRAAAAEKKAEKTPAEPSRIWVQVAGGANEGDLGKAYSAVQSRAPALKGRAAYSTPLRATNRVVTGPFKTDAEARAFVNQLAKQGVSAFPFTSDKGQKMTKLPPK